MDDVSRFIGVPFGQFLLWLRDTWVPGKHMAFVGPTGEGKSTLAVHALKQRKWVLALDPKGEDTTLEASGFIRVTSYPLPRKIRNAVADKQPARLIIGGSARSASDDRALLDLMGQYLTMARHQGGWTVYADEFQVLADARMFGLGIPVERMLITARKDGTSVLTSFQAPAWVPKASTRQAGIIVLWPTRDEDMIKNAAKAAGRPYVDVMEAMKHLPPFHCLVIPPNVHAPMLIINPPKVG